MGGSIVRGRCAWSGRSVAVSPVFPKGLLTSECADGMKEAVGLFPSTSLRWARVLGGVPALRGVESELPLTFSHASGGSRCPGRTGSLPLAQERVLRELTPCPGLLPPRPVASLLASVLGLFRLPGDRRPKSISPQPARSPGFRPEVAYCASHSVHGRNQTRSTCRS